jgi:glutamate/tyrosine decarboxylase-like PLP-dependent enzyme
MSDPRQLNDWIKAAQEVLGQAASARQRRPVTQAAPTPAEVDEYLAQFDFAQPMTVEETLHSSVELITRWGVNCAHPRYFGWLNPTPTAASITADLVASALNPQLAVWAKSPGPVAAEQFLIRKVGLAFGLGEGCGGTFTTGGTESNLTALILALDNTIEGYRERGLFGLTKRLAIYVSQESHKSVERVARVVGLGSESLRVAGGVADLTLNAERLSQCIERDLAAGWQPLMVVGNAGSTNAGVIDPLDSIADVCARYGLWFHVDAAWGGAAALSEKLGPAFRGLGRASSVSFDPHKWLSMPLGSGMLLCADQARLPQAFAISARYATADADPYQRSLQWSRRFIGLRVFMALLAESWTGMVTRVERHVDLAETLRGWLLAEGWVLLNPTPLPILCVALRSHVGSVEGTVYDDWAQAINARGQVRLSATRAGGQAALRICICSHLTEQEDLRALMTELAATAPADCAKPTGA